jgi:hypothetical protein
MKHYKEETKTITINKKKIKNNSKNKQTSNNKQVTTTNKKCDQRKKCQQQTILPFVKVFWSLYNSVSMHC